MLERGNIARHVLFYVHPVKLNKISAYRYPGGCKPAPPTNVTASASNVSCTPEITVGWIAPTVAPLPESYNVTCTDADSGTLKASVGSDTLFVTFDEEDGITPDVKYKCQVVSVREDASSDPAPDPDDPPEEVEYRYENTIYEYNNCGILFILFDSYMLIAGIPMDASLDQSQMWTQGL